MNHDIMYNQLLADPFSRCLTSLTKNFKLPV